MVERLRGTGSGYGIVRFNKKRLETTVENWAPESNWSPNRNRGQSHWPVTIPVTKQYGRKAAGHLPEISIPGSSNDIVAAQVLNQSTGEIEYTRPVKGGSKAKLKVFDKAARYTVTLMDSNGEELKKLEGQKAQ